MANNELTSNENLIPAVENNVKTGKFRKGHGKMKPAVKWIIGGGITVVVIAGVFYILSKGKPVPADVVEKVPEVAEVVATAVTA